MASEKLVRCELERADGTDGGVRFVPLEIFGLWERLMQHGHGLRVRSRLASVWVELEEGGATSGVRSPVERVTELCLFVFDSHDGMLHRNCRYVPTAELESVREIVVGHYRDAAPASTPWLRERDGVWFRPRLEADPAGAETAARR